MKQMYRICANSAVLLQKKKKLFFRLFNMREDIFVFLGILDPSSRMSACSPELHLLKQTNRLQVVTEIKKKKKTEKEMRS